MSLRGFGVDMSDPGSANFPLDPLLPHAAKALVVGRLHLSVLHRRMAAIRALCGAEPGARALEMFWVIVNAMSAELEHEDLTQKQLTARVAGAISNATMSRTIHDAERLGWIRTRVSPSDQRSRVITALPAATAYFRDPAWIGAAWDDCLRSLAALREETCRRHPEAADSFDAWLDRLRALADLDRLRVLGHLQLTAFDRFIRILIAARGQADFVRGHEAFWVVVETILAAVEGRVLTQKELTARAAGLYSAPTLSRVVQDAATRGWIVSRAGPQASPHFPSETRAQ
jgi:hypothetical protein